MGLLYSYKQRSCLSDGVADGVCCLRCRKDRLKPKVAAFIAHYVELVRQNEEALGHPADDGPSFQDMLYLYKSFEWLDTANTDQPPSEIHALMELIAEVRDSWADPENDSIGRELFPLLSEVHHALGQEMDKAVPQAAALREQQEDLRALATAIRRTQMNPPPSVFKLLKERAAKFFRKKA